MADTKPNADPHIWELLRTSRKNATPPRTLQAVADGACISVSYLAQVEKGFRGVRRAVANAIADELGIDRDAFWQSRPPVRNYDSDVSEVAA